VTTVRRCDVLRRFLWWLGLSVLFIVAQAVGASADSIDIVDTAQLADMCTRLASGIPLTMTTQPTSEPEPTTATDDVASADATWATPEADYTSIMQHALSGFTTPASPAPQRSTPAAEAATPQNAPPKAAPKTSEAAPQETTVRIENCEPGVKVSRAAVLPAIWIAAFGAPGLVAIVVSIFGIIINRPEPED